MIRSRRWRLLPDSVFGRFLAVLIVCCALAQFVAVVLVVKRSASWTARWEYPMADEAARRLLDILALLQTLQPEQRIAIANQRQGRPIDIDLSGPARGGMIMAGEPPPLATAMGLDIGPPLGPMRRMDVQRVDAQQDAKGDPQRLPVAPPIDRHRFGEELARRIGPRLDAGIEVRIDAGKPQPAMQAGDDSPSSAGVADIATVSVRWPNEPALAFHVGWSRLAPPPIGRAPDFKQVIGSRLAFQLTILLAGLSLGAYLAARRITNPLSRLAAAADALGRSLNRPPLPETGPRELRQVAQGFNVMQDRLRRHIDSRTRVVAAMSHDLRTPLTRLRASAEDSLRRATTMDEARAGLERAIEESDKLIRVFDQLQMIARAETGHLNAALDAVPLDQVLPDLEELYAPAAEESSMPLSLSLPSALQVRASRELLSRALANLIENALKYGKPAQGKGEITLTAQQDSAMVEIIVADRGPGIPAEAREKVLERFVRLDKARNAPGFGLGLSLVSAVARLMGGSLRLEDNAPGLRAVLRLPKFEAGNLTPPIALHRPAADDPRRDDKS
ncbi:MAG: HAMP domain-containing histidine kinase [Proteobacteria bacterium]|nr:HAMP domain-containing histidine kinase [Pseudomonadota bacterium]